MRRPLLVLAIVTVLGGRAAAEGHAALQLGVAIPQWTFFEGRVPAGGSAMLDLEYAGLFFGVGLRTGLAAFDLGAAGDGTIALPVPVLLSLRAHPLGEHGLPGRAAIAPYLGIDAGGARLFRSGVWAPARGFSLPSPDDHRWTVLAQAVAGLDLLPRGGSGLRVEGALRWDVFAASGQVFRRPEPAWTLLLGAGVVFR